MKLEQTRTRGDRWCTVEMSIENGRFSISGLEGRIVSPKHAKKEAFQYWESFFEDQPEEIGDMRKRFPQFNGCSPKAAARFVLDTDGEYHGLDVHATTDKGLYLVESCGQIREVIADFFPEYAPFAKYHLNDMKAECEHQEARGENWTTHPGAICPECGWKLGHAWGKRELPADLQKQIEAARLNAVIFGNPQSQAA